MKNRLSILASVGFSLLIVATDVRWASAADSIEPSVVKLLVTKREPDYFKPWTKAAPEKVSGSGVVIGENQILTNAHVVMHASQVFVQMRRGGDEMTAKVKAIGPGIDLAIVELTEPEKLKDVPVLPLADELPQLKSHVSVYGYPAGGDDLSVTDGIVSRIEFANYNFACDRSSRASRCGAQPWEQRRAGGRRWQGGWTRVQQNQ